MREGLYDAGMNKARHRWVRGAAALGFAAAWLGVAGAARAWDAIGHRAITWLALDGLDPSAPGWMREPGAVHMIGWNAAEPDRWRGTKSAFLVHENAPDHFIDIEDLAEFGMTLETISPLRMRFVRDMAVTRAAHKAAGDGPDGERGATMADKPPYNERLDPTGQQEWCGFLPHAIAEHQAKLVSGFKTYRMLVKLNDPARGPQLEMAKANIMATLGSLSHFVGDAAQPLHTTRHYNGWIGTNPNGYTVAKTFHAYIDGGVLKHHGLDYHSLRAGQTWAVKFDAAEPWKDILSLIQRSHAKMETLYQMEKSGELRAAAGKALIEGCLHDAAATLAAIVNASWAASEPSEKDIADFIKYDSFDAGQLPGAAKAAPVVPATPVAPAAPAVPAGAGR